MLGTERVPIRGESEAPFQRATTLSAHEAGRVVLVASRRRDELAVDHLAAPFAGSSELILVALLVVRLVAVFHEARVGERLAAAGAHETVGVPFAAERSYDVQ